MGSRRISSALRTASPKAIVSVEALLKFRWLMPALWRISKKFSLDSQGWGIIPFDALIGLEEPNTKPILRKNGDQALITFTSGTTGAPKGAQKDRNCKPLGEQFWQHFQYCGHY